MSKRFRISIARGVQTLFYRVSMAELQTAKVDPYIKKKKKHLRERRNNLLAKIFKIQPTYGISGILIYMNYR